MIKKILKCSISSFKNFQLFNSLSVVTFCVWQALTCYQLLHSLVRRKNVCTHLVAFVSHISTSIFKMHERYCSLYVYVDTVETIFVFFQHSYLKLDILLLFFPYFFCATYCWGINWETFGRLLLHCWSQAQRKEVALGWQLVTLLNINWTVLGCIASYWLYRIHFSSM